MGSSTAIDQPLINRLPTKHEIASANQLRRILAARMSSSDEAIQFKILDEKNNPAEVILTRPLSELFIDLLRAVGGGDAVVVMPLAKQLTTQEAADFLNVSRPHLIKLLENGEMHFETVGRHRRVKAVDVFEYKVKRNQARSQALSELAETDSQFL
jgi:excisionase family DNA binding protein